MMNVAEESMEGSVPEDTETILEGVSLADDILVTKDDEITITGTTTVEKMDIDMLENEMVAVENKIDDSSHVSTELILSEVKEQVLKEVEEMQNAEMPSLDSAVAAVDIENLLDSKGQESPKVDAEPQIGLDDIKDAQNEIGSMDILVCGGCHIVTHFMDAFQSHKENCKGITTFHANVAETKPQVWAFLLWKHAQKRFNIKGTSSPTESAWKLYQKWTKMPRSMRDAWTSAGETIMNFKSISSLNICDTLRAHGDKLDNEVEPAQNNFRSLGPKRNILNESLSNFRNQLEDIDSSDRSINDADFEAEPTRISFPKFTGVKATNNAPTHIQDEFVVEKIVSRRFNPRKKQYEYLLKWEGYPSEQNTWEPAENLEACQHLLQAFEESLSKQSKLSNKINLTPTPKKQQEISAGPSGLNSIGRPVRYSKQKALNQVKAWCGSIKPDDSELDSIKKRGMSDSEDEEDSILKRIKLNPDTDSEDSLGGRIYYNKTGGMTGIIKKSGRGRGGHRGGRIAQNGISNSENLASILGLESSGDEADGKKLAFDLLNKKTLENKVSSLSPANQQVLVANAKGVVKVDNAQVPNLASGVYIMSNKSGIIKLDSVSPSKALSLKQGHVKELTPSKNVTLDSGVVVLNKNQTPSGIQKTGILRKNSLNMSGKTENILQRSVGRPPKPAGHIKINNSTTRLLHSGAAAKASINATPTRPKLPLKTTLSSDIQKKPPEIERRVLGSKMNRGGLSSRGSFRSRGGHTGMLNNSLNLKDKDVPVEMQSSDSDQGIPDDFPADLPPIGPESPPRPLTLCPKTGKVLSKAEGERTPEPTPPPSPLVIKEDAVSKVRQPKKKATKPPNPKETIVRKTIGKPGSIGSVSISPKKQIPEVVPEEEEYVHITGEDGLLYKILKSELNNTIMVEEDGQQCVYVTTENGEENAVMLGTGEYSNVTQIEGVNVLEGEAEGAQFYIKQEEGEVMTLEEGQVVEQTDENASQLVAQLVEASGPAPGGGPRQVVLMLPDGSFVMTEVDEEQFAALEFDKMASAETTETA